MTTSEAIKYWKKFRHEIDALSQENEDLNWDEQRDATKCAIAALRAQLERENPEPLTLDELREMNQTPSPVWVVCFGYIPDEGWHICRGEADGDLLFDNGYYPVCLFLDGVIKVYRHKPKEATP